MTKPTLAIGELQELAWANKLAKGFGTDNIDREFNLLRNEIAEAYDAWRHGDEGGLAAELADAAIFVACLAQMTDVDLEQAVIEKLAVNAQRTYRQGPNGFLLKTDLPQAPDTH